MSVHNPWTKHHQSFWTARARNLSLPLWHRVYALAYGRHRCNGHAPFGPGELAMAVPTTDKKTGEVRAARRDEVSRAIRMAVSHGFLAPESWVRCLVVPDYAISGGLKGSPTEICKSH